MKCLDERKERNKLLNSEDVHVDDVMILGEPDVTVVEKTELSDGIPFEELINSLYIQRSCSKNKGNLNVVS